MRWEFAADKKYCLWKKLTAQKCVHGSPFPSPGRAQNPHFHGSVVFPERFIEFDSDPNSKGEFSRTDKPHCSLDAEHTNSVIRSARTLVDCE